MFAQPVAEVKSLRTKTHSLEARQLDDGVEVSLPVSGKLFDVEASFDIGDASRVTLNIGGNTISYNVAKSAWHDATTKPTDGTVNAHVLLDRSSIEVWG
ncbi:MAG: GH32 C-terminal domain-containing protein [Rubripirellula sp.]